ncbi:MAG: SAM-dependent chlorinase/fluorinase [Actinomycetota bacterium]|nr:SAM-dependent chlorinase/fluorinase [Actinomycetota bacterium]
MHDEFVGAVHLVIAGIAPQARVIDLTHGVAAHDVSAAARVLVRSVPWLSGVVLAAVDPGAGTTRRAVVVEALDQGGRAAVVLVGPDNGLLVAAVRAIGGFGRVVALVGPPRGDRPDRGSTFAGRDVLAAAAAHLCNGVDVADLGPAVDPVDLVDLRDEPATVGSDGTVVSRVQWIDRFGNVELNVPAAVVLGRCGGVALTPGDGQEVEVAVIEAYEQIPAGQIGVLIDSEGWICVAAERSSAAAALGLAEGDRVVLRLDG